MNRITWACVFGAQTVSERELKSFFGKICSVTSGHKVRENNRTVKNYFGIDLK